MSIIPMHNLFLFLQGNVKVFYMTFVSVAASAFYCYALLGPKHIIFIIVRLLVVMFKNLMCVGCLTVI